MSIVIYHDLECRLTTYNGQKFLTLENDKDWEKSCKFGFSEPQYGLWGLSVLAFTDYKKDKDIVVGASSVGRFVFENYLNPRIVYALENYIGPVGVPVYYQISIEEYDDFMLLKKHLCERHEHKPLCGFVKNKEVFSEYDCDENMIYKGE